MYTLKVKITKELIEKSSMCGYRADGTRDDMATGYISESCLFALAFRNIFPRAWVDEEVIYPFGIANALEIESPKEVTDLIKLFDSLNPGQRIEQLQEQEIDIPIPDSIITQIDISEVTKQLQHHPTLALIEE